MPDLLYRETGLPIVAHDVTQRIVTVRLCRWNDARTVTDQHTGTVYREMYRPGSIDLAADVGVVDRHDGALVGRALPETFTDDGDGPVVDLRISRTAAGNDLLELVDDGTYRSVSMEVEPVTEHRDAAGVIERLRSTVHNVAFAFRPAHDAPILATREQSTPIGEPVMPVDTVTPADLDPDPADTVVAGVVTGEVLNRELDEIRREIAVRPDAAGDVAHPLAQFRSLDAAVTAAWSDPAVRELLHRALADQVTDNNPGVIPPAWSTTVYGIVDRGRPLISAFGVADAGETGMEMNWPFYDGDLSTLVAEQVAQKDAITSARVDLKRGSADLATYAGGSDIAYQLIRRSAPSYRDAYMRIMFAAFSAVTDAAAAAQITAGQAVAWDMSTDNGVALRAALFAASVRVEAATGTPASFAVVATDVFVAIGEMEGILTPTYGTQNVPGVASAATLDVNVNGLPVIHDPYLANGTAFVSNSMAGGWYEDGPYTVAAEDVERLGQNVAVWGLGVFAAYLPNGIVELNASGTPTALASPAPAPSAKSSK